MMIAMAAPIEPQEPVFPITIPINGRVLLPIDAKNRFDRFADVIPIHMDCASINQAVFLAQGCPGAGERHVTNGMGPARSIWRCTANCGPWRAPGHPNITTATPSKQASLTPNDQRRLYDLPC